MGVMSKKSTDAKNSPTDKSAQKNPMWGGRFAGGASAVMDAINVSIDNDKRFYAEDIAGSLAHAQMLQATGIISAQDCQQITQSLQQIGAQIKQGNFEFSRALEDIHMNIEYALSQDIGEVAGRLHTARSRNDQVATDFRLYIRNVIDGFDAIYCDLLTTLLDQAEKTADMVMPGYTHLQVAQPVTFGHHLMAYVEMFSRDQQRLQDCRKRVNQSPLGAAALAGTSFPIDRHMTADLLGFDMPMRNSLDAVSARDFALEFLSCLSIAAMHLSRLAEEFVLWSSAGFRFINLPDSFTSGSSIMPQKKNPDAAELVRAKSGRILGSFVALMQVMKALPLAYSKDMQEDKSPVFEAVDAFELMLRAMIGMIEHLTPNADKMLNALQHDFPEATDLADWLVQVLGIPFRQAHHVVGGIVAFAETKKVRLGALSLAELQQFHADISAEVFTILNVEQSVHSRHSFGGTAPDRVREAIIEARKKIGR